MDVMSNLKFLLFLLAFTPLLFSNAFGHGVGSETFPPVELDGKMVTLEVASSNVNPYEQTNDQKISISLIDFDSKITLRDVTFDITAHRGNDFLFEQEFQSNNGFVVFKFVSANTSSVLVEEQTGDNFFGSLIGMEEKLVTVSGPDLGTGGLYRFDIQIKTANSYSNVLEEPLIYNSGISIPMVTEHYIEDPNYGTQKFDFITYYAKINDFKYEPSGQEITFEMPFEWSQKNIDQTSVVHEEIRVPKLFGDMHLSSFTAYINGIELPEEIISIDDFYSDWRIIHLIINQQELQKLLENNSETDGMSFLIKPKSDDTPYSSVTSNGQFRIYVWLEPSDLKPGSDVTVSFDVTDVFLRDRPISASYDFSVTHKNNVIYSTSGTSVDTRDEHNIVRFTVPNDASGLGFLNFENLGGNGLAKTSIPIIFDRVNSRPEILIPDWIRNNAAWWADGQIDDSTFVSGIQFLIKQGIIRV